MPNDRRLQAAQEYIIQPIIQRGYKKSSGGSGTVIAIIKLQQTLAAQAHSSTAKRKGLERQSSRIQSKVGLNTSIIVKPQLWSKVVRVQDSCPCFRTVYQSC